MRPKFDRIYSGPWPYPYGAGVGICMARQPGTHIDQPLFLKVLHTYGCHPAFARHVLDELLTHGSRSTTITRSINFNDLHDDLLLCGVAMAVVPPKPITGNADRVIADSVRDRYSAQQDAAGGTAPRAPFASLAGSYSPTARLQRGAYTPAPQRLRDALTHRDEADRAALRERLSKADFSALELRILGQRQGGAE